MKIFFWTLLLISFVLSAEIDSHNLTFHTLLADERFLSVQFSKFLGIQDKSKMCRVSKFLRRILRKLIMPQLIQDYKSLAPSIRITSKSLKEFETIWKISHYKAEQEWIRKLKEGSDIITNRNFTPRIDFTSNLIMMLLICNLHFPILISELLKVSRDEFFIKMAVRKIFSNPSLYIEALRVLAKEVYKCKRDEIPTRAFAADHVSIFQTFSFIEYNEAYRAKFLINSFSWVGLQIFAVFIGAFFMENMTAMLVKQTACAVSILMIIYKSITFHSEEYEEFK